MKIPGLKIWAALVAVIVSCFSQPALALKSHSAEYEVFWGDRSVANLAVNAEIAADSWVIVSKLNAHGIAAAVMPGTRTQTSTHQLVDGELQQKTHHATRTKRVKVGMRGSRDEEVVTNHIDFDHANGTATATEGSETVTLKIEPLTADRESLTLLVAERWKNATAAERKAGIPFPFINGTKTRLYTFYEAGEETLETPAGTYQAVKLVHGASDDKHTVVWLAKELDYFPIGFDKIKPRSKGVTIITRLSQVPTFSE